MRVRRIVAALHPQAGAPADLDAIVELARSMDAELLGLFIEDIALLHFAALPFAREVCAASAVRREVDVAAMERSMRNRAEELRGELAAALGADPLPWSFRIARGTMSQQLLAACAGQPGPTLILPPGSDADDEPQVLALAELNEARLRQLLESGKPILVLAS